MFTYRKKLSVVLPAFNESDVITESIDRLISELKRFADDYEIIVVNDGSVDDTKQKIINLKKIHPQIKLVSYKNNKGKGYAIKRGLLNINGDIVVLMDADLDIHPSQIRNYLKQLLQKHNSDKTVAGAIGSKLDKRSNVDFPLKRRLMSFCYYLMLKTMFRLDTRDTNTGLKVFNSKVIKDIVPQLVIKGYAYDIELLSMVYKKGYRVLSLPVNCEYSRNCKTERIQLKHAIDVFNETLTVFIRNYLKK